MRQVVGLYAYQLDQYPSRRQEKKPIKSLYDREGRQHVRTRQQRRQTYLPGLHRFAGRGVSAEHVEKLCDILARLDAASTVDDMDLQGFKLHALKGQMKGFWAVTVRANWRVVFRFVDGAA